MDTLRFPLGVLTGVGFIGGGAILKRGALVTGVTTAATMWVMTAIGLCIGGGQLLVGGAATVLVLLVLSPLKYFDRWIRHTQKGRVTIEMDGQDERPDLRSLLDERTKVEFMGQRQTDKGTAYSFALRWKTSENGKEAEHLLAAIGRRYRVALFEVSDETD
jgi:putative Mg2+ transporter-C (MgtC) family protein